MESATDDREDTLLDRMEHIAEEEEEDMMDENEDDVDDESIDPHAIFGQPAFVVDVDGSDDEILEEEDEEKGDYQWSASRRVTEDDVSQGTSCNSADYMNAMISGFAEDADLTPHSSLMFDSASDEGSSKSFSFTGFGSGVGSSNSSGVLMRSGSVKGRRGSFATPQHLSSSMGSVQSAPLSLATTPQGPKQPRRVTITAPVEDPLCASPQGSGGNRPGRLSRLNSRKSRRASVSLKSMTSGAAAPLDDDASAASSASPSFSLIGSRFQRKSRRRNSHTMNPSGTAGRTIKNGSVMFDSVDYAITSLGKTTNSEWENVAAAAAVVAAGMDGTGKRSLHQFGAGEKVLVVLKILNLTNNTDNKDNFTVTPVNRLGYPPGEGKTPDEQKGPYSYVLATVRHVHYDEDVPYYTVAREDTGTEQRADAAWMEQIKDQAGIEAATRVAAIVDPEPVEPPPDSLELLSVIFLWPWRFFKTRFVPFYKSSRETVKEHVTTILYGNSPYACTFQVTGINLLVFCSFTYLFIEVIGLAFLPASADKAIAVVGAIVWTVLAVELFLEWLIRPSNYGELIISEKAYAPSTSRNINGYHLAFELLALCLYVPSFICLSGNNCGARITFSALDSSLLSIIGPTIWQAAAGRFAIGLRTLRIFGLVRHWKKMWINNAFRDDNAKKGILHNFFLNGHDTDFSADMMKSPVRRFARKRKVEDEAQVELESPTVSGLSRKAASEDDRLRKAATIGTALMVVNSHRALFLFLVITCFLPMIISMNGVNNVGFELVDLLQENNVMITNANQSSCDALFLAVSAWLGTSARVHSSSWTDEEDTYVLWAQMLPVRCPFQGEDGVITRCNTTEYTACRVWEQRPNATNVSAEYFATNLGIRVGGIQKWEKESEALNFTIYNSTVNTIIEAAATRFTVRAFVNENHSVSFTNASSFLLLSSVLFLSLFGLTVLRGDAARLVLDPLQRMLKIVVKYARNPLSQTPVSKAKRRRKNDEGGSGSDEDQDGDKEELGNYETEQLINAISKIADLLRKCWGVAGAGIIASNLAREEDGKAVVFNPTVPGKRVYALFGFVAINGFSDQLRALDRDVMILINDVAKVVHDEVYRWALGDSGQCNKNLGAAFLMVFRIGDFGDVYERWKKAKDMVFYPTKREKKSLRRRNNPKRGISNHGRNQSKRGMQLIRQRGGRTVDSADTLQLASLPGIQKFSDRALLGMLKSFAGVHRDRNLKEWKKDFRLGAGVGAFTVNIIIGMDAGWAVEGAVGSEYKIDATYLSPHVNMASRMMSATKQYGVTILVSQAVEELLSSQARKKLRHLDTVYVKGSSVAQRIFTYDARHKGVDFFLFERSHEQSDLDAEAYAPTVWETDQDLRAMRQHVTEEFESKFQEGKNYYLEGKWKDAVKCLKQADDIMITTVLEEGYIDYNPDEIDGRIFDRDNRNEEISRLRSELGDGASRCLVAYMEKRAAVCPNDWQGVRPLTSK